MSENLKKINNKIHYRDIPLCAQKKQNKKVRDKIIIISIKYILKRDLSNTFIVPLKNVQHSLNDNVFSQKKLSNTHLTTYQLIQ